MVGVSHWEKRYQTRFRQAGGPFEVKFETEKTTGILLSREEGEILAFAGKSAVPPNEYSLRLTFDAAERDRNLYGLTLVARAAKEWTTEDQFLRYADRAFEYWSGKLRRDAEAVAADPVLYAARVEEYLAKERAAAAVVEDEAAIAGVQQRILDATRGGKRFGTAHHEGGTNIFFARDTWVEETFGEEQRREVFRNEQEFLKRLRNFYDWDSRKDTYPHRPPELKVWEFIEKQLR